jgi:hypothetical protein
MRSPRWLALVALTAALALSGCETEDDPVTTDDGTETDGDATANGDATAPAAPAEQGEHDRVFNLIAMSHTSPETVRGLEIEVETTPWDGESTDGPFSYASAPCNQDAPINNVSSNLPSFNTELENSRSPASTRLHPFEFDIDEIEDGAGEMSGTITVTVCHPRFGVTPDPDPVPDAEKDRIVFDFTATFEQPTVEETTYSGTFEVTDATGPYEGLQASGQIAGYLMCLGPEPCEQQGEFRDAQVVMIGTYEPPEGAIDDE